MAAMVPGPRGFEAFRTVKAIGVDPFGTLAAGIARWGDVVRYPGPITFYFLHHPDHVRQILDTNHTNYRRSPFYARMKPLLGEGLITSDGELWKRQRRLIQKGFTRPLLQSYGTAITSEAARMVERLEERARQGEPFDVCRDNVHLSLAIAGRVMFHADLASTAQVIETALPPALDEIDARFNELFVTPAWIPTPRNRRFAANVAQLDALVLGLIADRKRTGERHDDILSILLDAQKEAPAELSDRQIRDEVMTLMLAGHETTANLLSWTMKLLAEHPAVHDALAAEVAQVCGDAMPTFDRLPELKLLQRVLCESLRLYPPAWAMDREVIQDDTIGGHTIPAKSVVFFPPFFVHRHRDFWPDAEKFDPERFNGPLPHKFAFIPFGGGNRLCVGRELAMASAGLSLAMLVPRVKLALEPGHPVELHAAITLRPRYGLRVRASSLKPRS